MALIDPSPDWSVLDLFINNFTPCVYNFFNFKKEIKKILEEKINFFV